MKHCGSLCRLLEGGHQKAMSNMKHATALLKAFQKTPQIRCFRAPPFSVQTHSKTSHLQKTIDSRFLSSLLKVHNFSQWQQVEILCDFFRQRQFVPRLAFSLCTCHQRKCGCNSTCRTLELEVLAASTCEEKLCSIR